MTRTLEEARQIVSELSDEDRLALAEEIVANMPSDLNGQRLGRPKPSGVTSDSRAVKIQD